MSTDYKYFAIPLENVPSAPSYTAWYATWSKERPVLEPGMPPPMVVGVTADSTLPDGAILLGTTSKDPVPPPPPPPPAVLDQPAYQRSFTEWLASGRGADE
ncbi:MAG TPA: hypothetical protein VNO30_08425 [Kofleriaceae bacterium]|nr:hypothetical protein [Kofleriaceae bacterium]